MVVEQESDQRDANRGFIMPCRGKKKVTHVPSVNAAGISVRKQMCGRSCVIDLPAEKARLKGTKAERERQANSKSPRCSHSRRRRAGI